MYSNNYVIILWYICTCKRIILHSYHYLQRPIYCYFLPSPSHATPLIFHTPSSLLLPFPNRLKLSPMASNLFLCHQNCSPAPTYIQHSPLPLLLDPFCSSLVRLHSPPLNRFRLCSNKPSSSLIVSHALTFSLHSTNLTATPPFILYISYSALLFITLFSSTSIERQ